ncbi:MAG: hypothetical protein U1D55_01150 [Phycisphaerae bacterium]
MTAIIDAGPIPLRVVSVHLAGTWKFDVAHILQTSAAREADFDDLERRLVGWGKPHILIAGDFNQPEASANFGRLAPRLRRVDCGGATFPSDSPVIMLDHVLVPRGADIAKCEVIESDASDHRPLLVVLRGWGG